MLRGAGSVIRACGATPAAASCSRARSACAAAQITTGAAKPSPPRRKAVSWIRVFVPPRRWNCLGLALRESGQSLVPAPPDISTGMILLVSAKGASHGSWTGKLVVELDTGSARRAKPVAAGPRRGL